MADSTQPDDSHPFASQRAKCVWPLAVVAVPLAPTDTEGQLLQTAIQAQHERNGVLGDRNRVGTIVVRHLHAQICQP